MYVKKISFSMKMIRLARGQSEDCAWCDTIFCNMTLFILTIWQWLLLYTNTSSPKWHFDTFSIVVFFFIFIFFPIHIQNLSLPLFGHILTMFPPSLNHSCLNWISVVPAPLVVNRLDHLRFFPNSAPTIILYFDHSLFHCLQWVFEYSTRDTSP